MRASLALQGLMQMSLCCLTLAALQTTSTMTPEELQLTQCLLTVCNEYLPPHLPTLLASQSYYHPLVHAVAHTMHSSLRWQIVSSHSGAASHVLLLHSGQDLAALMSGQSWNTGGLFLVVTLSCDASGVSSALNVSRNHSIVNTLILAFCPETVDAYTWIPYHRASSCESRQHVTWLDKWLLSEGKFSRGNNLFDPRVPNNFHGCPFRVSVIPNAPYVLEQNSFSDHSTETKLSFDGGFEIQMLKTISDKLNFSVHFSPIPPNNAKWGRRLKNGTWTGIVGNVKNGEADVAFAGTMLNAERFGVLKSTFPYAKESISWVVPLAKPLPRWKSLIKVFPACIWLLVILTYLVLSCFLCFVSRVNVDLSRVSREFTSLAECLMCLFSTFLAIAFPKMPQRLTPRFLVAIFLIYSMVVNTAYRTFLITDITHPMYEHQMSSVEEILNSGIQYGFHPNMKKFFNDDTVISKRISNHHTVCMNVDDCFERVVKRRDFAIVYLRYNIEYILTKNYLDSYNTPLAKTLSKNVMSYDVTTYMQKDSIIFGPFNELVLRLMESGMIEKWRLDVLRNAYKPRIGLSDNAPTVLKVSHLEGAFVFLMIGLSISCIIFLCEILYHSKYLKIFKTQYI